MNEIEILLKSIEKELKDRRDYSGCFYFEGSVGTDKKIYDLMRDLEIPNIADSFYLLDRKVEIFDKYDAETYLSDQCDHPVKPADPVYEIKYNIPLIRKVAVCSSAGVTSYRMWLSS